MMGSMLRGGDGYDGYDAKIHENAKNQHGVLRIFRFLKIRPTSDSWVDLYKDTSCIVDYYYQSAYESIMMFLVDTINLILSL